MGPEIAIEEQVTEVGLDCNSNLGLFSLENLTGFLVKKITKIKVFKKLFHE